MAKLPFANQTFLKHRVCAYFVQATFEGFAVYPLEPKHLNTVTDNVCIMSQEPLNATKDNFGHSGNCPGFSWTFIAVA